MDTLPSKVGCFGHGKDEVGDCSGSWSVESESPGRDASLGDEQGVGWKWEGRVEVQELLEEIGHEVVGGINERSFPTFPIEA